MRSDQRVQREIMELHEFFVQWYAATLPRTDEAFARFADVMAPGFCIITPDGSLADRDTLMRGLHASHGAHRDTPGGFAIDIRNVHVRFADDAFILATYGEWQQRGDETAQGRLSTVLFTYDADAPNGLLWPHVHETWLPSAR